MGDYRDLLERERRRFEMARGTMQDLERRRDQRRRNRRITSGLVALIIAAAGIGAGVYALRPTGTGKPVVTPTPTVNPSPAPTPTPSVTPPVASEALPAPSGPVQFVDTENGWAVFQGGVYRTEDGGHTWSPVRALTASVGSVAFIDADHGWAVAQDGLLATVDGGASWERVNDRAFSTVQFVNARIGFAVRSPSDPEAPRQLVKTKDGGRSWATSGPSVDSVCAISATDVWAAGPGADGRVSVFRSADGGKSWNESHLQVPPTEPWTATMRCGGDDVWVLVQGGNAAGHQAYAVFGTIDGGATWRAILQEQGTSPLGRGRKGVYPEPDPYWGAFASTSPGAAVFVNYCPACFGSESATVTATLVSGDPPAVVDHLDFLEPGAPVTPTGVSFIQGGKGWLLLEDSNGSHPLMHVVGTTDGGRTWTSLCRGPTCSSA